MNYSIRTTTADDARAILSLIKGLADYEKLLHEVTNTEKLIREKLFGPDAKAHCLLAEVDGKAVGLAVYFFNYSTFNGNYGLYLEDFFVYPEYRGSGIGKAVFEHLIKIAVEQNCGRMEWCVLNWNEPAINFYKKYNATPQTEWTTYRLSETQLKKIAEKT